MTAKSQLIREIDEALMNDEQRQEPICFEPWVLGVASGPLQRPAPSSRGRRPPERALDGLVQEAISTLQPGDCTSTRRSTSRRGEGVERPIQCVHCRGPVRPWSVFSRRADGHPRRQVQSSPALASRTLSPTVFVASRSSSVSRRSASALPKWPVSRKRSTTLR